MPIVPKRVPLGSKMSFTFYSHLWFYFTFYSQFLAFSILQLQKHVTSFLQTNHTARILASDEPKNEHLLDVLLHNSVNTPSFKDGLLTKLSTKLSGECSFYSFLAHTYSKYPYGTLVKKKDTNYVIPGGKIMKYTPTKKNSMDLKIPFLWK